MFLILHSCCRDAEEEGRILTFIYLKESLGKSNHHSAMEFESHKSFNDKNLFFLINPNNMKVTFQFTLKKSQWNKLPRTILSICFCLCRWALLSLGKIIQDLSSYIKCPFQPHLLCQIRKILHRAVFLTLSSNYLYRHGFVTYPIYKVVDLQT